MKTRLHSALGHRHFSRNPHEKTKNWTLDFTLLALIANLLLLATPAQAANLLVNPGFETPPSGQTVPTGWKYFAPPTLNPNVHNYWVETGARAHTGSFY